MNTSSKVQNCSNYNTCLYKDINTLKSNFDFMDKDFPELAKLGKLAERYCKFDTSTCMFMLGKLCEVIVSIIFEKKYKSSDVFFNNTDDDNNKNYISHGFRIYKLWEDEIIDKDQYKSLNNMKEFRNIAAHKIEKFSQRNCRRKLKSVHIFCKWFVEVYARTEKQKQSNDCFETQRVAYMVSPKLIGQSDGKGRSASNAPEEQYNEALLVPAGILKFELDDADRDKLKEIAEELSKKASEKALEAPQLSGEELKERIILARQKYKKAALSEEDLFDEQLREAGWEADTEELNYLKGTRPENGRNMAIAGWITELENGYKLYADYALFIGEEKVGIVVKYKNYPDIFNTTEENTRSYSNKYNWQENIKAWNELHVPFIFATDTRRFDTTYWDEQADSIHGCCFINWRKMGIKLLDLNNTTSITLHGWLSPTGIQELLTQNKEWKKAKLQHIPPDFLFDKTGLALEPYQGEAVEAVVKADIEGIQLIPVHINSWIDQTNTVLGIIYRFLSAERFSRILLLVDESFLDEPSKDVFKSLTFKEICSLKHIDIKESVLTQPVFESNIQVATVHSLAQRTLYCPDSPCASEYDLIVEYNAEKTVSMDEFKAVLEYYYAVKILLNDDYSPLCGEETSPVYTLESPEEGERRKIDISFLF